MSGLRARVNGTSTLERAPIKDSIHRHIDLRGGGINFAHLHQRKCATQHYRKNLRTHCNVHALDDTQREACAYCVARNTLLHQEWLIEHPSRVAVGQVRTAHRNRSVQAAHEDSEHCPRPCGGDAAVLLAKLSAANHPILGTAAAFAYMQRSTGATTAMSRIHPAMPRTHDDIVQPPRRSDEWRAPMPHSARVASADARHHQRALYSSLKRSGLPAMRSRCGYNKPPW